MASRPTLAGIFPIMLEYPLHLVNRQVPQAEFVLVPELYDQY